MRRLGPALAGAMANIGLVAALFAAPAPACGCGVALRATIPAERALISMRGGREQLTVSFDILARDRHGAVVLPVPGRPTAGLAPTGLFSYLARATRPQEHVVHRPGPAPVGGPAGGAPVQVIGNERVGAFQVARLTGGSGLTLDRWLSDHGYRLPAGARPILASYVRHGWSFVAVRLANRANGKLTPLRIAFRSQEAVYPMRLDQLAPGPITVDLYVAGGHRVAVRGLSAYFAGRTAELQPAVPAALAAYLPGPFLTRLRGTDLPPSTLTHDFVARRAATDAVLRTVDERVVYDGSGAPGGGSGDSPAGLLVAVIAVAAGAAAALVARRRRHHSRPRAT